MVSSLSHIQTYYYTEGEFWGRGGRFEEKVPRDLKSEADWRKIEWKHMNGLLHERITLRFIIFSLFSCPRKEDFYKLQGKKREKM